VDLQTLNARILEAGRSSTTALGVHRILHRALRVAVLQGLLGSNPADRIEPPAAAKFSPQVFTLAEARRLANAAITEGNVAAAFTLMVGPRQAERLGLGWDMVDLKAGRVHIARTLNSVRYKHGCGDPDTCEGKEPRYCPKKIGGLEFGPTKSDAGDRDFSMPRQLVTALKEWKEIQKASRSPKWRPFKDRHGVEVDLVFSQPNGRPYTARNDLDRWHAFLKRHGAEKVRTHDARHTAATVLLALGIAPRVVMDAMGWDQESMLTRYQHVLDDMRDEMATQLTAAYAVEPTPQAGVISMEAWKRSRATG
jgi:integrase